MIDRGIATARIGTVITGIADVIKEAPTDADTFGVQFGPSMSPEHRALVLAATFLIDFLYFEDRE